MSFTFKPLTGWPGTPTKHREQGRFSAPYSATLTLLEKELEKIGARNITIYLSLPAHQIRQDGLPYAKAKPSAPGVLLTWEMRHKGTWAPRSIACDQSMNWQENLRAIALTLEALRAVSRWGALSSGEQYEGCAALPAETAGATDPAAILGRYAGVTAAEAAADPDRAYREALRRVRVPDHGGDEAEFKVVTAAYEALKGGAR